MSGDSEISNARVNRRRFMSGSAGALAGVGLAGTLGWPVATAAQGGTLPAPKPIPGGIDLSGFGLTPPYDFIHTFAPGPPGVTLPYTGVMLEGLDVEPSTISDFRGASALAYLVGTATGSDGKAYNLETDIRIMDGSYVSVEGRRRQGSFALI